MPLRDKIVLMGLGIFASCAAVPKFISIRQLLVTGGWTWGIGYTDMWSLLEISLGILAASTVALKCVLDELLKRLGMLTRLGSFEDIGSSHTPRVACRKPAELISGQTDLSSYDLMKLVNHEHFSEARLGYKRPVDTCLQLQV